MKFINRLKHNKVIRNGYRFYISSNNFFRFKLIAYFKQYFIFIKQFNKLKNMDQNHEFKSFELFPCLDDNTNHTPIEPTYFFQDTWAAKKIFELKPKYHIDIGSSIKTIGILSQFVPITFVDIRPIELELENLSFKQGSILDLPFDDSSIESISSLCVVEHIGLGRYGDKIDPYGSEKAINELQRVLKIGGILLISLPVDSQNKIYFNAHRAFTRDYILELFKGFTLLEEKYHYGKKLFDSYDKNKGFGTGLYMFRNGG